MTLSSLTLRQLLISHHSLSVSLSTSFLSCIFHFPPYLSSLSLCIFLFHCFTRWVLSFSASFPSFIPSPSLPLYIYSTLPTFSLPSTFPHFSSYAQAFLSHSLSRTLLLVVLCIGSHLFFSFCGRLGDEPVQYDRYGEKFAMEKVKLPA